jgi:hypothetical protein
LKEDALSDITMRSIQVVPVIFKADIDFGGAQHIFMIPTRGAAPIREREGMPPDFVADETGLSSHNVTNNLMM